MSETFYIRDLLKTNSCRFYNLVTKYNKGIEIHNFICCHKEKSDQEIMVLVKAKFSDLRYIDKKYEAIRAKQRVYHVRTILDQLYYGDEVNKNNTIEYGRYLDIGCGNGEITIALAKDIVYTHPYGIDVKNSLTPYAKKNMYFKVYNGTDIPSKHKFNLITLFMVIHHVPSENLIKLIQSIHDHMYKHSVLIVRDHDIITPEDEVVVRLQHSLMDKLYTDTFYDNSISSTYEKYYSAKQIISLFESRGFKYADKIEYPKSKNNPTNYVYFAFYRA